MKKKLILALILLNLTTSTKAHSFMDLFTTKPAYEKRKDKIIADYSRKLKKERKLYLSCTGGRGDDNIDLICLEYDSHEKFNKEQARQLLIECVEEFLQLINQDGKLKPDLSNYPFSYTNLDFILGFFKKEGGFVSKPHIAYISLINTGEINYYLLNEQTNLFDHHYKETYEEALKLLKKPRISSTIEKNNNNIVIGKS